MHKRGVTQFNLNHIFSQLIHSGVKLSHFTHHASLIIGMVSKLSALCEFAFAHDLENSPQIMQAFYHNGVMSPSDGHTTKTDLLSQAWFEDGCEGNCISFSVLTVVGFYGGWVEDPSNQSQCENYVGCNWYTGSSDETTCLHFPGVCALQHYGNTYNAINEHSVSLPVHCITKSASSSL